MTIANKSILPAGDNNDIKTSEESIAEYYLGDDSQKKDYRVIAFDGINASHSRLDKLLNKVGIPKDAFYSLARIVKDSHHVSDSHLARLAKNDSSDYPIIVFQINLYPDNNSLLGFIDNLKEIYTRGSVRHNNTCAIVTVDGIEARLEFIPKTS